MALNIDAKMIMQKYTFFTNFSNNPYSFAGLFLGWHIVCYCRIYNKQPASYVAL